MKYTVIRSRKSDYPIPIKLHKGDIVAVKKSSDDTPWGNWIMCEINGISGWFPVQFINQLGNEKAVVIESYDATEMDVIENDIVITDIELNGWVWAKKDMAPNEYGWIPLENLKPIDEIGGKIDEIRM